ncbi:MAG TPA: hypothetical protein VLA36_09575 [Longimicrobiales bacterium]|nr:hypothetical protein [Longimicrobiales bacterium]
MPNRPPADLDPVLRATLAEIGEQGWEIWAEFDRSVRQNEWHPFVPADYERVLEALLVLRAPGLRFLEWGSATGVITIMADLLGYEAYGIELDEGLVNVSVEMAARYGSGARFAAGSFLPAGYTWSPRDGDGRMGTVGAGTSGYLQLGHPLDDFDLVYAFPWGGEESMMHDLMRKYGGPAAGLLLNRVSGDVELFRRGKLVAWQTPGPAQPTR